MTISAILLDLQIPFAKFDKCRLQTFFLQWNFVHHQCRNYWFSKLDYIAKKKGEEDFLFHTGRLLFISLENCIEDCGGTVLCKTGDETQNPGSLGGGRMMLSKKRKQWVLFNAFPPEWRTTWPLAPTLKHLQKCFFIEK